MTNDELKAAAARWTGADYGTAGEKLLDAVNLADYAAASLDETPIDRAWLVKLLGEPIEEFHGLETWSRDPKAGPWLDRRPDGKAEFTRSMIATCVTIGQLRRILTVICESAAGGEGE